MHARTHRWSWSHLVADEAHALKNSASLRARNMMKLAELCDHRVLLTGVANWLWPEGWGGWSPGGPPVAHPPKSPPSTAPKPHPALVLSLVVVHNAGSQMGLILTRQAAYTCCSSRRKDAPPHTHTHRPHPPPARCAGTPLQNDLRELLALLRFLMPGMFSAAGTDDDILSTELQDAAQDVDVSGARVVCVCVRACD